MHLMYLFSQRRNSDPSHMSATLRGELDWIVMKALEKDRSRRYESASAFASDVQRYLSDEPVHACPPSTVYRFQKFARKHRTALAASVAIAISLIFGTTVSAWQAVRATQAEAQANANATESKEKTKEATELRDEAQRQRDEVKALYERLTAKEQQLQRSLYASNINLAKQAWDVGAVARVEELLEQLRSKQGEPDLRGFEWHYLRRLCHSELLSMKHDGGRRGIQNIAYSPDGQRLASASRNSLKVWNAQTGQESFSVNGATVGINFSPDGKRIAGGCWEGDDPVLKVWDAYTAQELLALKGHSVSITRVAFSRNGKLLASASSDTTLRVWNAESGEFLLLSRGICSTE